MPDDRDVWARALDAQLEATQSALLFARFVVSGFVPGLTMGEVRTLAERYCSAGAPACRYWNGNELSSPREEAKEARQ